jgi:hypothetical protein
MKTALLLLVHRLGVRLLFAFGLVTYQPSSARSLTQPTRPPAIALRVIITPLPCSAVLRVRYENDGYGPVRLQLRDTQDRVVYSEVKRQARFAGDYILASFPAGNYVLELQTPRACYTQLVYLHQSVSLVATQTTQR